jgi:hypothetical protein
MTNPFSRRDMTTERIQNQSRTMCGLNVVPDSWAHLLALLCATLGLASIRVDNRNTRDFVGHGVCDGMSFSGQGRSQSREREESKQGNQSKRLYLNGTVEGRYRNPQAGNSHDSMIQIQSLWYKVTQSA